MRRVVMIVVRPPAQLVSARVAVGITGAMPEDRLTSEQDQGVVGGTDVASQPWYEEHQGQATALLMSEVRPKSATRQGRMGRARHDGSFQDSESGRLT
mgnify:CR=1 FL=1